jgi:hypothetical protein
MDIITILDAKAQGLKRYYTGEPCIHKHITERSTNSGKCIICVKEANNKPQSRNARRKYADAHPEQMKAYWNTWYYRGGNEIKKQWKKDNSDKQLAYDTKYRVNNPTRRSEIDKKSYQKHIEKRRAKTLRFAKANPAYYSRKARERRGLKKTATPKWADHRAINDIYLERDRITMATGIQHHVDHIVPLHGNTVCGLHVEYNLQILTIGDNLSKGNRYG